MPLNYARRLTGRERDGRYNFQLGVTLAFIAGAINAGGFLAVHQYTSHMTGIVSSMADSLVLNTPGVFRTGIGALLAFIIGAATSAFMVREARRRGLFSEYAIPLFVEALLLLGFGLMGGHLVETSQLFVPVTVMLLCFIMGLQNALITKLSHAEIRTTHVTGTVTDIGVEIGRYLHDRLGRGGASATRHRPRRLASLVAFGGSFFLGGWTGAYCFHRVGFISVVPLALVLGGLASVPLLDDLRLRERPKVGQQG